MRCTFFILIFIPYLNVPNLSCRHKICNVLSSISPLIIVKLIVFSLFFFLSCQSTILMYCYNCFCSFGICVYYHILSLIINIHIFINLYKKYQIHSFVKYQAVLLFVNCFELFYVFTLKRKNRNILFVVSGCTVYFFLFCTCSLFHC